MFVHFLNVNNVWRLRGTRLANWTNQKLSVFWLLKLTCFSVHFFHWNVVHSNSNIVGSAVSNQNVFVYWCFVFEHQFEMFKSIKNNRSFNFTKPLLIFLNKKLIYQEFLNMKAWWWVQSIIKTSILYHLSYT